MKRLFLTIILVPLFSGATYNTTAIAQCDTCAATVDSADTTIPAAIKDSLKVWSRQPADSFREVKTRELDSLKKRNDSLKVEVMILQREHKKKVVRGEVDIIKSVIMTEDGPLRDQNGNIVIRVVQKRWYYWRYPDGEMIYKNVQTKRLPNETIEPSTL